MTTLQAGELVTIRKECAGADVYVPPAIVA